MAESWTRALHCACRTFVCHLRYVIAETTVISSTDPVYNTKSRKSPLRRLVASQHMTKNTRLYSPALLLQRCSRAAANQAIDQGLLHLATTLVHTTMTLYASFGFDAEPSKVQTSRCLILDSSFAMSKDESISLTMYCTQDTIVNSSPVQLPPSTWAIASAKSYLPLKRICISSSNDKTLSFDCPQFQFLLRPLVKGQSATTHDNANQRASILILRTLCLPAYLLAFIAWSYHEIEGVDNDSIVDKPSWDTI